MDDIPNRISIPVFIWMGYGVHEESDPYIWLFHSKTWVSTELFLFWTYALTYDKFSFCFHALLYITECFCTSYDRNGSIFVLILLILNILMVFQTHSVIGSVLLMTLSAICMRTIESFILLNILKSYCDWIAAYLAYGDTDKFAEDVSSRLSDFIFIVVFVTRHVLRAIARPHYTKEDILLIPILTGHIIVYFLRLYTKKYFCIILALTVVWMHLKACKFARIRSILTENFSSSQVKFCLSLLIQRFKIVFDRNNS